MSGNNNTTSPPTTDDEYKKQQQQQTWSAHMFGYNVPYWVIVLVVVIIVYLIYTYTQKTPMQSVSLNPTAKLALGNAQTISSPTSSMNVGQGAASVNVASPVSDVSTRKLQRELRELFSKY
jgi:hypothetical protein